MHLAALRKGEGSARGLAGGQGRGGKGDAVFASCRDAGKGAEQARSGAGGALRAALQSWRHRGKSDREEEEQRQLLLGRARL